jgi:hypothetical protein
MRQIFCTGYSFIFRVFEKFYRISDIACILGSVNSHLYENLLIRFVGNCERNILSHIQCSVVEKLVRILSTARCGEKNSGPSKEVLDEYFGS